MINVINSIIDNYGKPDEIRIGWPWIEKKRKGKGRINKSIAETTRLHEQLGKYCQNLLTIFPISATTILFVTKLYEELKENGYKTLYSNTYISPQMFSAEILMLSYYPQSRLFDDSFSNKTLELRALI
jgi:CRISPR-associated endonuclease Csn1